jgi:hypothetical protein
MVMRLAGPLFKRFEPSAGKRVSSIGFSYPGKVPLSRLAAFRALEKVEFTHNVELVPPDKDPLVEIPSVDTIVIRYANLYGGLEELGFLKRFPNLRSLAIRETTIAPAAMQRIEESQVESLELYALYGWSALGPQTDFSALKKLHRLKVDNALLQAHPHWLNSAPSLRRLIVCGYSSNTPRIFPDLQLPQLHSAHIHSMQLSQADFVSLLKQPQLTELEITWVLFTNEDPLRHLEDSQIESLTLTNNRFDDDALAKIAKIRTLRRLELNEPLMNYQTLHTLAELPLLEELKVPPTVPASALPKLKGQ